MFCGQGLQRPLLRGFLNDLEDASLHAIYCTNTGFNVSLREKVMPPTYAGDIANNSIPDSIEQIPSMLHLGSGHPDSYNELINTRRELL